MERWKTEVEKRALGKVKVQTFPGGTLLGAKNMFDGVVSGVSDIGCFAMSYQPGRFPVSEAVDLPLELPNAKVASFVLYDLIMKYNPKEFKKVKIVTLFTCPPTNFMTSKPVKTLEDLKGMELRVAGTGAEVVKRLGGVPVAMPQSETPEAIQKGVVKGMVSSLEILKDFNFASFCPFATIADLHVVTFAVVMNKDKWDALPEDVKKVIDGLSRDQCEWTGKYVDNHVTEALEWSKKKYHHQVFALSSEDMKKAQKHLKPMTEEYIKKTDGLGLDGRQIIRDVKALKAKYTEKSK
jgi:TRAP-type C4-dicarboxylate transport system substrate-binding protein